MWLDNEFIDDVEMALAVKPALLPGIIYEQLSDYDRAKIYFELHPKMKRICYKKKCYFRKDFVK